MDMRQHAPQPGRASHTGAESETTRGDDPSAGNAELLRRWAVEQIAPNVQVASLADAVLICQAADILAAYRQTGSALAEAPPREKWLM